MKNITENNEENKDTKTPVMTEEEMKKFISVISEAETIQGDYIFNGFLFFFQSVYETIKANPVEAQNLMFHLQQHVFNNLMWESYHAFEAHRRKAHLIFGESEPFVYEEEETAAEETAADENVLDLSAMSVEDLNTDDERIDGTIEELASEGLALVLSGILNNPNLPEDIYNGIRRRMNDVFNSLPPDLNHELASYEDSPEYLAKLIKYSE